MNLFTLLALNIISLVPASHAAVQPTLCDTFISCGTFEGTSDEGRNIRIKIKAVGSDRAHIDYEVLREGEVVSEYPLDATITEEGLLTMRIDGRLYTAGSCANKTCTYGMRPWQPKGATETIGNAGIFKFFDDRMELRMNWGTPSDNGTELMVLPKKGE